MFTDIYRLGLNRMTCQCSIYPTDEPTNKNKYCNNESRLLFLMKIHHFVEVIDFSLITMPPFNYCYNSPSLKANCNKYC